MGDGKWNADQTQDEENKQREHLPFGSQIPVSGGEPSITHTQQKPGKKGCYETVTMNDFCKSIGHQRKRYRSQTLKYGFHPASGDGFVDQLAPNQTD